MIHHMSIMKPRHRWQARDLVVSIQPPGLVSHIGYIISVSGNKANVYLPKDNLCVQGVPVKELAPIHPEGIERVRVIDGDYSGLTGRIVCLDGPECVFMDDDRPGGLFKIIATKNLCKLKPQ